MFDKKNHPLLKNQTPRRFRSRKSHYSEAKMTTLLERRGWGQKKAEINQVCFPQNSQNTIEYVISSEAAEIAEIQLRRSEMSVANELELYGCSVSLHYAPTIIILY